MAFVSVIVPLYNVRDYVGECIASLRAQTFGDFEVVCVNDGSTDDSLARARAAAGDDGRFRFVERPNGGLSAARNTGLAASTGDYVCFLDSDDAYEPYALQHLADQAREHDLDLLDFSAATFYDSDEARRIHEEDYSTSQDVPGIFTGRSLFVRYWDARQYRTSACFHLMRRSMLAEHDLTFCEGLLHEDELFMPLVYAVAGKAAFLNEPLYRRRMRTGSIMTATPTLRSVNAYFRILQMLQAWIAEHAEDEDLDADFADAWCLNISFLADYAGSLANDLDPALLENYIDGLSSQDRVQFNQLIRYATLFARERQADVEESRTYRIGKMATALPRALRDWRK